MPLPVPRHGEAAARNADGGANGAEVAGQVDHHGDGPLADGRIEDTPGIADVQRPIRQVELAQVLEAHRAELHEFQVRHVMQVPRRKLAQQDFRALQECWLQLPPAVVGWKFFDLISGHFL